MDLTALRTANPDHWFKAAAIRALTLDAVAAAKSGHSGMPMGMADVATVLFEKHLKFVASDPKWPDRDRFILSAGHGSMLLYSILHLVGDPQFNLTEIKNFRQLGARTAGHPENFLADAIETTTGPLGQGLANAVGFAMAEESLRARYGRKVVDHRTYVIAGDGCLMEGVSHEAIALAGKQMLRNLIVFWDNNGITIDGHVDLADITDQVARFKAAGWHVQSVDGHNPEEIHNAIEVAKTTKKPSMIDCRTHIALGHAAQDTAKGHGALTDPEQLAEAKAAYGWEHGPFEIPEDVKAQWEAIGQRGLQERDEWQRRFDELPVRRQDELKRMYDFRPPHRLIPAVRNVKRWASEEHPNIATRKSSELLLGAVNPVMPEMIGGSADLTGSNNTNAGEIGVFDPENRKGRYIHYGIREHGMAAVMNGMALHGGVRPYGGTFMCFTDYARPAMRLSALMKMPVVYVMTHDSIGLGEDGPTHQPVEHLAISRATPNTYVFRPADTVETAESWELALGFRDSPSVIALSRQSLPAVRLEYKARNQVAYGAYILAESTWKRQVILLASGSEVHVALAARERLESLSLATRVVSVPCMELFAQQDEGYRRKILPSGPVRVAIEAGVRQGWDRWLFGERGRHDRAGFIGMSSFGASAPADQLFSHFDITVQAIVDKVKELYV